MYKISNQQINSSSTRHAELVSASYVCRNPHVSSQTPKTLKQVQGDEVRVGLRAFTLAEVMIVLAIIGILVAILLPTAQNLTPDEDLLKFKKANTSLTTAIREMVNSNKYYYDGDLGLDKEGNKITEPKYFCSVLSDILTTKKVSCSDSNLGYNSTALANLPNIETDEIDGVKIYEYIDCMCKQHTESGEEITLNDNTIIYTINPYYHFGSLTESGSPTEKRLFNLCSNEKRYKFICMDIDQLNQGEDPFGYAIRADGKIIYGAKASAWIKKAINNNDEETIFATTDSCPSAALTVTPENDVCKTVVQTPVVTPTPTPEPEPEPPVLASRDTWFTKQTTLAKVDIVNIEFVDFYSPSGSEYYFWNASDDESNPLMAYAISDGNGAYNLKIAGNGSGKIRANTNSTNAFMNFYNLTTINFYSGFDVSNVVNMDGMFAYVGRYANSLNIFGVESWDVSNVIDMDNMFLDSGYNANVWNIGDLSAWDVSNVTDMHGMFAYSGHNASYTLNLSSWDVRNVTNHANFNLDVASKVIAPSWVH